MQITRAIGLDQELFQRHGPFIIFTELIFQYSTFQTLPHSLQVLVRPSPSSKDNCPIEITPRLPDSSVQIVVHSSWWLVEDYAAFSMLNRQVDPNALLGVVDATYTINLTLQNFLKDE